MAQTIFIPLANGQRISAILQKGLLPVDNNVAEEMKVPSSRALVIMVHGFPGHKSTQNDVFGELEFHAGRDDFHSLRFDFRGCGESEGKSEDFTLLSACDDMESILSWARSYGYKKFLYIGEGLGATLALLNLTPEVCGTVLLWPALDPRLTSMKEALIAAEDKKAQTQGYVVWKDTKIGLPFIEEIKSFNPTRKLRNLKIPLLIQQGASDEEVSPMQMELLRRHARSIRRIEMTTYEGAGHGLRGLNERQTMFYHVRQFLKRYG